MAKNFSKDKVIKRAIMSLSGFFLLNLSVCVYALSFPPCQELKVASKNGVLMLNGEPLLPAVYLLKNKSTQPILLNHSKVSAGASAGWASRLSPGNWSGMVVTQTPFSLSCALLKNYPSQLVNCKQFIFVCRLTLSNIMKADSSYWLVEDVSRDVLLQILTKH